jgi:hypothetical protein
MNTTRVYIDGFNLFHGLIRENNAHWLDLSMFTTKLNRGEVVERIIYCTAMVSGTPTDPAKPDRQEGYLRAVAIACPNVEVVFGNFRTNSKPYPLDKCRNDPTCAVRVSVRTEKGSDVNLASRLLHDAHLGRFSRAIVISGDSDLAEPIRLITQELGKIVWVRNPRDKASQELEQISTNYDRIRPAVALSSQLPEHVTDGSKTYSKPSRWSAPKKILTKNVINNWTCSQAGCGKSITGFRYE